MMAMDMLKERGVVAQAEILGTTGKKIFIISRCPGCGFICGIVPPDQSAIYYNPAYVDMPAEEIKKIPAMPCGRPACPAEEIKKTKGQKRPAAQINGPYL